MTHGGTETEYQLQTWQSQNLLAELVLKEGTKVVNHFSSWSFANPKSETIPT